MEDNKSIPGTDDPKSDDILDAIINEVSEKKAENEMPEPTETSAVVNDVTDRGTEMTFGEKFKERVHDIMHEISEQNKEIFLDFKEEARYKRNKRRKEFYGGTPPRSANMRALYILLYFIKKVFSIALTTLFSLVLVGILTATIVGTTITVYLLSFMDSTASVVLEDIEESFSSYIYQLNKETNEYDLVYRVTPSSGEVRIKTDIDQLADHTKYAFTSIEDERFYSHEGVDYKRTGAAVVNLVLEKLKISDSHFGGSTITQQLIKNITQDKEDTPERKMREIFSAMKFEKKYTKDDILESYLNTIYFDEIDGYHMYGIEAASIGFFGKSATELTIAEAACLAAMPKAPNAYNPIKNPEDNKERMDTCLYKMFELGIITPDEYEEAINTELDLSSSEGFNERHPNAKRLSENDDEFKNPEINSWCVDAAINEIGEYLQEKYNLKTFAEGRDKFNHGGYKIYLSYDTDVQAHLDSTYENWYYFPERLSSTGEMVQSSLAVLDYKGFVLGLAGKIGGKKANLDWNNATDTHRQPGSTIKPVTTYGYGIETDKITWSTMFYDRALPAGVAMERAWPDNYDGAPSGGYYPVWYFLKQSINTLPAQIVYNYGHQEVFDFATQRLHLDLDPTMDMDYSPLCVGGTYTGPSALNLANAYLPYGNGGTYYKATLFKKVVDIKTGMTIIDNEKDRVGEPAVSDETAYIMNKLLQRVITDGTGTAAQLSNTTLAGKTGTTENWRDIAFVGLTPDYCSAMWVGYPTGENPWAIEDANSARIWYNVFGTYANATASGNQFPECETIVYARYCSSSGMVAGPNCPGGQYGYYKSTYTPYCSWH